MIAMGWKWQPQVQPPKKRMKKTALEMVTKTLSGARDTSFELTGLLAFEAGLEDALGFVLADFDGVWVGGVDGELAFGILHAGGVEDFFGGLVDDLDDGILKVDFVCKVTCGFAAVVVAGVEADRPAWELGVFVFGDVGEAFVALEGDFTGLLVEAGDSVAVGALLFIADLGGIGVGEHRDFVAEAVEVVSGPGKRGIWNRIGSGFGVGGVPPATVDGVDEGGGGEGVWPVVEFVDSVTHGDGEMLVTAEVGGVGASDFAEGVVATGLGPGV